MIKIDQLIKKINNTELGKTGTHETYVHIPTELDISSIFPNINEEIEFKDRRSNSFYKVRLTKGREQRICGLGPFYRDKQLCGGDEILFEKRMYADHIEYIIDYKHLDQSIILKKSNNGFEVLNQEHLNLINNSTTESQSGLQIKIEFSQSIKKRADSQVETQYYNLILGNKTINDQYSNKDILEIKIKDSKAFITKAFIWKKISFAQ